MKKNLFVIGFLAITSLTSAQVLTHVDDTALFYIGENALVYSGGGVQTKGTGVLDVHGNVMVVGSGTDVLKTLTTANANKTDGGNIILRLNDPTNYQTSTYGQLYIQGLSQTSITGIVNKEIKTNNHGTYHQIALPFYKKTLNTLNAELGKTFTNVRYSKNEILKWDNRNVKSIHYTSLGTAIGSTTADPITNYYMLGMKNLNLASAIRNLKGVPSTNGVSAIMKDAGLNVSFGPVGNYKNSYNEFYYSYLQDAFEAANPWVGTFGRNMYQYGNPYFTNLDLSKIGVSGAGNDGQTTGDGNALNNIVGIRYNPGSVVSTNLGGTTSNNDVQYTTFANGIPAGDVGMLIKPLGTFVIKFSTNTQQTLNFDGLRRFSYSVRDKAVNYSVTASKMNNKVSESTLKQLAVIGLDANEKEIARTYYVVYPNAVSGHPSNLSTQVTSTSSNILGTYEEDAVNGGYDYDYTSKYWLYINEANEQDFYGKAVPLVLYSPDIKFLKFELREDAELLKSGTHQLSTGTGFYYQPKDGNIEQAIQDDVIKVEGTEYYLYFGNTPSSSKGLVSPSKIETAPSSRTMVTFNPTLDSYVVLFDPNWKGADVKVYDMSGKIVLDAKNVETSSVFEINLPKDIKSTYVVSIVSDKGDKVNTKIIR